MFASYVFHPLAWVDFDKLYILKFDPQVVESVPTHFPEPVFGIIFTQPRCFRVFLALFFGHRG